MKSARSAHSIIESPPIFFSGSIDRAFMILSKIGEISRLSVVIDFINNWQAHEIIKVSPSIKHSPISERKSVMSVAPFKESNINFMEV